MDDGCPGGHGRSAGAGDAIGSADVAVETDLCEVEHRDAMVAFLEKSFGTMTGAAKLLRQRIELTDQCIAQRALVEPSVRAWLKAKR